MGKNRLLGFSDGVIAIIITIMVLEMKVPYGEGVEALRPLLPLFLSYVLSFLYVGIYWHNHHHMLQLCHEVTGSILWANLHLLFWLSLFPFATGWMGANRFAAAPSALYGAVLLVAAAAYWILQQRVIASRGPSSALKQTVGSDWKGRLSLVTYVIAIVSTGWSPWIAQGLYVMPANWAGYPEHDHARDGQEEVYVVLRGSAQLQAGDQSWRLEPGTLVRVGPGQKRKITPGGDGVTLLALGGTSGKAYEPPSRKR
jgi:uncharacterized membrane protein